MTHDPRSRAPADTEFEQDERPTRPAPPPPEHLRLLRSAPHKRARVAARRRPALTPATQSWLATKPQSTPRTATSRWRAIAATVLGGGTGRQSLADPAEVAPAALPSVVVEPEPAEAAVTAPRVDAIPEPTSDELGPRGTRRITAPRSRPLAPTLKLPATARATPARSTMVRRCVGAGCAVVLCLAAVVLARRGVGSAPAPPVVVAATIATPVTSPVAVDPAAAATATIASTEPPSPAATTPASSAGAPRRPSPRARPRRQSGSSSSSVF